MINDTIRGKEQKVAPNDCRFIASSTRKVLCRAGDKDCFDICFPKS